MSNQGHGSAVDEFHSEEETTFYLCDIVNDELVVEERCLYKEWITAGSATFVHLPEGTKTPSMYLPLYGAVLPQPFVECLPGGSRLA